MELDRLNNECPCCCGPRKERFNTKLKELILLGFVLTPRNHPTTLINELLQCSQYRPILCCFAEPKSGSHNLKNHRMS